jgi:hypothetical protein
MFREPQALRLWTSNGPEECGLPVHKVCKIPSRRNLPSPCRDSSFRTVATFLWIASSKIHRRTERVNSFAFLHFLVQWDRRVDEARDRSLDTVREHVRGPEGLHSCSRCCLSWRRQRRPRAVGKAAIRACNLLLCVFWMGFLDLPQVAATRPTARTGSPKKTALRSP